MCLECRSRTYPLHYVHENRNQHYRRYYLSITVPSSFLPAGSLDLRKFHTAKRQQPGPPPMLQIRIVPSVAPRKGQKTGLLVAPAKALKACSKPLVRRLWSEVRQLLLHLLVPAQQGRSSTQQKICRG